MAVYAEYGPPTFISAALEIGFKPRVKPVAVDPDDIAAVMAVYAPGGSL